MSNVLTISTAEKDQTKINAALRAVIEKTIAQDSAALQAANNLSDVADAGTSRTNLGLGTAAVKNTGTSGDALPLLNAANAWSEAQTFINSSGIKIKDTDDSHTLGIIGGSNLTSDRTLTIATGDADRTLTMSGDATISGTNTGDISAATQAEEEAASSTTVYTTPGRQHYHPGVAKCWLKAAVSGGTPTLGVNYNINSITDTAPGRLTVTIETDFSSANWCALMGASGVNAASDTGGHISQSTQTAGAIELRFHNAGTNEDPTDWFFAGFGDQ